MDIAPRNKTIAGVVFVVILGAVFAMNYRPATAPEGVAPQVGGKSAGTPPAPGTTNPGSTLGAPVKKPVTGTPPAVPKVTGSLARTGLSLITPAANDAWSVGRPHLIVWNKPANAVGGLALVDAATKKFVGWVLPSSGGNQTSYTWDSRDVSDSRTGSNRTILKPGEYLMRLTIDSYSGEVFSSQFTVVAEGAAERITPAVRFKNTKVDPASVAVFAGTKIIFLNSEAKSQKVSGAGLPSFTVPAGGTYVLDTTGLVPNTYWYQTDLYTYQAPGSIVVK